MNVNIVEFMSTSAFVEWTVPTVASSREQYVAMYGTDRNALIKISDLVQGLEDTSIDDQTYGIRLTSLIPSTTYFVRILAINNVGSTSSEIISFTTRGKAFHLPCTTLLLILFCCTCRRRLLVLYTLPVAVR